MRIHRIPLIVALVVLGLVLLGCGGGRFPSPSGNTPGGPISSVDGKCQIQTPSGWTSRADLHSTAGLQASNAKVDAYIIVLSESKLDFAANYTYRDYDKQTLTAFLANLKDSKITSGPKEVTVNGRPGIQYEFQGTVENIQISYFRTAIDGQESFHQVVAWTIRSKTDTNRNMLQQLINSFQENNRAAPK
jgi:hypothetical protein